MKWFMWVFMLVCNLLIPAAMIGHGRRLTKNPPKEINMGNGYRTNRSMKNQETWDFAQLYCGKVWWKWGRALIPLAVVGQALTLLCPTVQSMCRWSLAPTTAEVVVMAAIYFPVERALKRNFDKDGKRLCEL